MPSQSEDVVESGNTAPPNGVEQIEDEDGPPPPVAMFEAAFGDVEEDDTKKQHNGKLEAVHVGPPLPPEMQMMMAYHVDDIKKQLWTGPEVTNFDERPPSPRSMNVLDSIVEKSAVSKKKSRDLESRRVIHQAETMTALTSTNNGRQVGPTASNVTSTDTHTHADGTVDDSGLALAHILILDSRNNVNSNAVIEQEQNNEYAAIIPEAVLVVERDEAETRGNENVIINAEPLLPWYKQTRTKLLFACMFVLVATLAISLGISLSDDDTETITQVVILMATSSPSVSIMPSVMASDVPSVAPSLSGAPSPFPTTLMETLHVQKKAATDGNTTVAVRRGWDPNNLLVTFYASGEMEPVAVFWLKDYKYEYTVALNGNTTRIDFPDACSGEVIYVRDSDIWAKTRDSRCEPPIIVDMGGKISLGAMLEIDWSVVVAAAFFTQIW